jgi:hypothetical protein
MLPLSGLSSVGGKSAVARFGGGMLSSNSGVLVIGRGRKRRYAVKIDFVPFAT